MQSQAAVDHQAISAQVEELSGYLDKVEDQIQKLLAEVRGSNNSALEVQDLHGPPLTERADIKVGNFVALAP